MGIHERQHSGASVRIAARLVGAALIPALALGAVLFSSAPPASAATSTSFAATAAPLSYGGNDYTALLDSAGTGSVYLPASSDGAMSVTTDGTIVPGIPGDSGAYDFDIALARFGNSYVTMYVEASMFEYYSGGPYWHSCSGFESLMAAVYGGSMTVACDNFAWNILESNGPYRDFTFTGYTRFERPGAVTATTGYSDPALTYLGEPPTYYASATPLSFAGADYNDTFDSCTKSPPATTTAFDGALATTSSAGGVLWLTYFDENPQFVTEDNTPIVGIPDSADQVEIDVILLTMNGVRLTAYLSSTWRTDASRGGPYEASCAGFIGRIGNGGSSDTITCDNFKAAIFTPNGPGEDFTFTGRDGFETAGGVGVVSGFSAPAWLTYGAYTPAPTTTTTAPATTTSTAAATTTTTTAAITPSTTATTVAPIITTLPATGTGGSRTATLLAIALLGAGTALLRNARDRAASNATRRPSR